VAYADNGIPGVLRGVWLQGILDFRLKEVETSEMLRGAGGFGSFCTVLLSASLLGNLAGLCFAYCSSSDTDFG